MSPEQADSGGVDVDTRTDVYSLGVLLYELLAGEKPYALASKTLDEVLRLLTMEEPSSPAIANRELHGDLEAIILKAMRKEPGERYASAEELSEDLGRYLAGQPVSARHASFRYLALRSAGSLSAADPLSSFCRLCEIGWSKSVKASPAGTSSLALWSIQPRSGRPSARRERRWRPLAPSRLSSLFPRFPRLPRIGFPWLRSWSFAFWVWVGDCRP